MAEAMRHRAHVYPVRVYYEDTDAGGIVYYANYLKYAERARTEMLRDIGSDHATLMERHGIAFAVRNCAVDYRLPARLDDALEVHTTVTGFGGATLSAEQVVRRDDEALVHLEVRLACLNAEGRVSRMPAPLRHALHAFQRDH